ncbi:MAG TPA: flagellar motor protein MotB [Alphaproteobacteria bacterium]|nr:flagellar motor protein MotB [Alphaproteobacteria bacterium]
MAADGGAAANKTKGQAGQPVPIIIIKKVKKVAHAAHHGGAWKVAYADFVTAMMAFFLLLWLLNATTEEQKTGISNYFAPEAVSYSQSGAGGLLGGRTPTKKGANKSPSSPTGIVVPLPREKKKFDEDGEGKSPHTGKGEGKTPQSAKGDGPAKQEDKALRKAADELRQAIEKSPELKGLTKNLLIETTPKGLRIQLVDRNNIALFPLGSANMLPHTRKLLKKIGELAAKMDNKIAIAGHTDAAPYADGSGYSNWELSADRANSTRRMLQSFGVVGDRVVEVIGKAEREPLIKENPRDPRNRRISITLIRKHKLRSAAVAVPAGKTARPPAKSGGAVKK